jgi:hypothetical protein
MIENDPFDLSKLKLPPEMIRERRIINVPRKIRHGHFVKVPCFWIQRLAQVRYKAPIGWLCTCCTNIGKSAASRSCWPTVRCKWRECRSVPSGAPCGNSSSSAWSRSSVGRADRRWSPSMYKKPGAPVLRLTCAPVLQVFVQPGAPVPRRSYVSSVLSYFSMSLLILIMGSEPTLASRLAQFDEEHEFLRRITVPEEDRSQYTSAQWSGEYRWFRSSNVVCLEKVRRLRMAGRI